MFESAGQVEKRLRPCADGYNRVLRDRAEIRVDVASDLRAAMNAADTAGGEDANPGVRRKT